jgi:cobyric acid synthase
MNEEEFKKAVKEIEEATKKAQEKENPEILFNALDKLDREIGVTVLEFGDIILVAFNEEEDAVMLATISEEKTDYWKIG